MIEQKIKVEFVKWGFADRYPGGIVEVNRNLRKNPYLLKKILNHEMQHDEGKNTKKDILLDLSIGGQVPLFEQIMFMFKNPTSFASLLPIRYKKKWGLILDWNGILWWLAIIIVTILIFKFI